MNSSIRRFFFFFLIISKTCLSASVSGLSGTVLDSTSYEPLIYANIFIEGMTVGTITDKNGYFYMQVKPGKYRLIVTYIGYEKKSTSVEVKPSKTIKIEIKLKPTNVLLETVEVKGLSKTPALSSAISLQHRDISIVPVTGDKDLARMLTTLPGITFNNETSSKIYIRGGDPDQTLYMIDGAPVAFPSHLFGIYSMFNTDAIKNVQVIKSNPPLEYFGKAGSVVDIINNEGNRNKLTGNVKLGLLNTSSNIEFPFALGTMGFSFRRTYFELIKWTLLVLTDDKDINPDSGLPEYYFHDFHFKTVQQLNERIKLTINGYKSRDYLNNFNPDLSFESAIDSAEDINSSNWRNEMYSIKLETLINPQTQISFQYYNTKYGVVYSGTNTLLYNRIPGIPDNDTYDYFNQFNDQGLYVRANYRGFVNHFLKTGLYVTNSSYKLTMNGQFIPDSLTYTGNNTYISLYAQDSWNLSILTELQIGSRFTFSKSLNKPIFDMRVAFKHFLTERFTIKGGLGKYSQYQNMVTPQGLFYLESVDLWIPATDENPHVESNHLVFGFDYKSKTWGKLDVEGYATSATGNLLLNPYEIKSSSFSENFSVGSGYSYGVEFLYEKNLSDHYFRIGYNYSKSFRKYNFPGREKYYRATFNRAHDINLVTNVKISNNWVLNISWFLSSGQPYTAATGAAGITLPQNIDVTLYQLSGINEFELPPYHRLDIGLVKNFKMLKRKAQFEINVFNVYNHRNTIGMEQNIYLMANRKTEPIYFKMMPILPSIGLNVEF
ncbi:MAG: carboxypeptidase-like regulatory domain-containing protein [Fidelibacterota bacterium]